MSTGRSSAKPAGLSQLNLNTAGIDVGATSHFVAVPAGRAEQPVQEFRAFTADLYRLADWLTECGVQTVVMQPEAGFPAPSRADGAGCGYLRRQPVGETDAGPRDRPPDDPP